MNKVYLDDLPKKESGKNKGCIDWKESIGHKVKFTYSGIADEIEIVDYKKDFLTVKYQKEKISLRTGNFRRCQIGKLLGKKIRGRFEFDTGTIITDITHGELKIISQIRISKGTATVKAYEYKCLICGNEDRISEYRILKKHGCNVCSRNRKVVIGYNDLWTTNPETAKLLTCPQVGLEITSGMGTKEYFSCPECNYSETKIIQSVTKFGFKCPKCSDGISYPEKFVFNMLLQLSVGSIRQKIFEWSINVKSKNEMLNGNKKYDFYIPDFNCIIEVHGKQHYKDGFHGARTLNEEQKNDTLKESLAKRNNIERYIVLDCSLSDPDYIKNSIINSDLANLINLDEINWHYCHKYALSSLVKESCELWQLNFGVNDISNKLSLDKSTVRRYLKQGNKIGLCDYDPKEESRKNLYFNQRKNQQARRISIVQLTNNNQYIREWNSTVEAEKKLVVSNVNAVLKGRQKSAGGYKWMYKEDYEKYIEQQNTYSDEII